MGKRGPQKTTTAELKRRGSWRAKEPERVNEIKVDPLFDAPDPPEWMTGSGKIIWNLNAPPAFHEGLLTRLDMLAFGLLCERMAEYLDLSDRVLRGGPVTKGGIREDGSRSADRVNPCVKLRDEASRDVVRMARECGLTVTSRIGLVLTGKPNKQKDNVSLFAKG